MSGQEVILKAFEWLGLAILAALAILLVRALFRPWREGKEGNRPYDRDHGSPASPYPPARHDDGPSGHSDGGD
jgi:hypothetical protein